MTLKNQLDRWKIITIHPQIILRSLNSATSLIYYFSTYQFSTKSNNGLINFWSRL